MKGPLKNTRHERFAQELAKGSSAASAYVEAGYKPSDAHASRLAGNGKVQARVAELQQEIAKVAVVDAAYVLRQAVKLHEKCMDLNEHNPAARALEMVGKHVSVQAFREQHGHSGPDGGPIRFNLSTLTDEELDQLERLSSKVAIAGRDPGGEGTAQG